MQNIKRNLIIVIAPQEYNQANHKSLWHSLSKKANTTVLIMDVPADRVVTYIKRKVYRIKENKQGLRVLGNNIYIYRPIYFIRPEIIPNLFNYLIRQALKKQVKRLFNYDEYNVSFIAYDPKWVRTLKGIIPNTKIFYYILDELNLFAHNNKKMTKNIINDKYACKLSSHIFVMTRSIKESRKEYEQKITVLGNGSDFLNITTNCLKIEKSVGYNAPQNSDSCIS